MDMAKLRKCLILIPIVAMIAWLGSGKLHLNATEVESAQIALEGKEQQIETLNQHLKDTATEINLLQKGISEKQETIMELEDSLRVQQGQEQKLYEQMKIRIQFMYENSGSSLMEKMLESKSIAEFLNAVEYTSTITNYDRQMLKKYELVRNQIQDNKNNIEKDQKQMIQDQEQCQLKQQEIVKAVKTAQQQIVLSKEELTILTAKAEEKEKQLEAEIERKQQELLEKIQIEEKKPISPTITTPTTPTIKPPGEPNMNQSDEDLLAALIECESGNEIYEGKIAVGSVVLNRVASGRFRNSIYEVIYQPGQFAPAMGDTLGLKLIQGANQTCRQAAKEVLGGIRNTNHLFFKRYKETSQAIPNSTIIGNHVFYGGSF